MMKINHNQYSDMIGITQPYTFSNGANDLAREMCRLLGLNDRKVYSLDISFRVDELPKVTIGEYIKVDAPEYFQQSIQQYQLTRIEND